MAFQSGVYSAYVKYMHIYNTYIVPQLVGSDLMMHPTRSLLTQPNESANLKPDT